MEEISTKVQERRLKWCWHVMRKEENYTGRRAMDTEIQGVSKRGRPKRIWLDRVRIYIKWEGSVRTSYSVHGSVYHLASTSHKGEH